MKCSATNIFKGMTKERRNALFVVVVLIVTTTYQAALSLPRGVCNWQGDDNECKNSSSTFNETLIHNTLTFNTTHPIRDET